MILLFISIDNISQHIGVPYHLKDCSVPYTYTIVLKETKNAGLFSAWTIYIVSTFIVSF